MSQLRTAILELQSVLERTSVKDNDEIVSFEGKKGKWRTSHGSRVFIPMDGSAAEIPTKGPDINLDKEAAKAKANQDKAPPAAGGTVPKSASKAAAAGPETDLHKAGAVLKKSSLKQKASFVGAFLKNVGSELSDAGKNFVREAPWTVARFIADPDYRKKHMSVAAETVKNFPKKTALNLFHTAVEEAKEGKHAVSAIGKYMSGKKPTDGEKHALKTIATHIGIGMASRALHSSGLGLPVAIVAGVAKLVAIKALSKTLAKMHTGVEGAEIAHGVAHHAPSALGHLAHLAHHAFEGANMKDRDTSVLSEGTSPKQILKFLKMFASEIASEMKNITPEDIAKITDEVAKEAAKAADKAKKESAPTDDLATLIEKLRG
jgi:hypothetical protein